MKKKNNPKDVKKGCVILTVLAGIIIAIILVTCNGETEKKLTKAEIHQQNIDKLFSGWDGSHIKLAEKIKASLNDPKSYEHIDTKYIDKDTLLIVTSTFTAKNGFGGTLKREVVVLSDTLGNIIEVLQWID